MYSEQANSLTLSSRMREGLLALHLFVGKFNELATSRPTGNNCTWTRHERFRTVLWVPESFTRDKAAGECSWPLTSTYRRDKEWLQLYVYPLYDFVTRAGKFLLFSPPHSFFSGKIALKWISNNDWNIRGHLTLINVGLKNTPSSVASFFCVVYRILSATKLESPKNTLS